MEQKKIRSDAKKRRARLLAKLERTGWTQSKLALKEGVCRSKMSRLLARAREEQKRI